MSRLRLTSFIALALAACDETTPKAITAPDAVVQTATVTKRDIGTLGGTNGYAMAINDSNQVAGHSDVNSTTHKAFIWKAGHFTVLPNLAGSKTSVANGINSKGQVVGYVSITQINFHASLWRTPTTVQDLGTLGGPRSIAYAINTAGTVVGASDINQYQERAVHLAERKDDRTPHAGWPG
jgi:probable HAF family extracellular repeat protein